MKTMLSQTPRENNKSYSADTRPCNKNHAGSRANEEQEFKGRDITYNQKQHSIKPGKNN